MSDITEQAPVSGLKFDSNGLLPCIMQDARSGEVLTLAWMNLEAFKHTLETGLVVQVPEYLSQGEVIKVDTRTGEYLSRA